MSKEQVTRGLLEIGACWAVSDEKYQGTGFNEDRPTWHVHPDSSYPHEADILRFDTLAQVQGWIDITSRIKRENIDPEQAYDLIQTFWMSIE